MSQDDVQMETYYIQHYETLILLFYMMKIIPNIWNDAHESWAYWAPFQMKMDAIAIH